MPDEYDVTDENAKCRIDRSPDGLVTVTLKASGQVVSLAVPPNDARRIAQALIDEANEIDIDNAAAATDS